MAKTVPEICGKTVSVLAGEAAGGAGGSVAEMQMMIEAYLARAIADAAP